MPMIETPDSLRFFWGARGDNAAIALLAGNAELPGDLTWEELPRFAAGQAGAERVKADLWRFLYDAWQATWGEALKAAFPAARLGVVNEYEDEPPSVARVWENRGLNNWAEIGEGRWLQTSVWVDGDYPAALKLGFYLSDDERRHFADAWSEPDDGDPWRNTRDGVTLPGDGPLDLTALRQLAETALGQIVSPSRLMEV